jgi:uncharacterized protein DUF2203
VRFWTVEEARDYLPRLRQLLALVSGQTVPGALPGTLSLRPGAEHAEAALAELEDEGIVLRQVDRGLVDFPAVGSDGQVYLLCWHVGEHDLGWWHRPEDGFAGRQPLPLP